MASVLIWTQLQLESRASALQKLHLKNHILFTDSDLKDSNSSCHHSFLKFDAFFFSPLFFMVYCFIYLCCLWALECTRFLLSLLMATLAQLKCDLYVTQTRLLPLHHGLLNQVRKETFCIFQMRHLSPEQSDPPAYLAGSGLFGDAEECPLKSRYYTQPCTTTK